MSKPRLFTVRVLSTILLNTKKIFTISRFRIEYPVLFIRLRLSAISVRNVCVRLCGAGGPMQFRHSGITPQREFERSPRRRATMKFHGPAKNYYRRYCACRSDQISVHRISPIDRIFP